jgi:hypothetical protein
MEICTETSRPSAERQELVRGLDHKMKKIIKSDWLVGKWECESSVVLEIKKHENAFGVRAIDKYDKEEFIVSKINWDGKCLRFETYVPSTKYRTRNSLTPISKTKLIQELTLWESWKKIALKGKATKPKVK